MQALSPTPAGGTGEGVGSSRPSPPSLPTQSPVPFLPPPLPPSLPPQSPVPFFPPGSPPPPLSPFTSTVEVETAEALQTAVAEAVRLGAHRIITIPANATLMFVKPVIVGEEVAVEVLLERRRLSEVTPQLITISVIGNGSGVILDGAGQSRLFSIFGGVALKLVNVHLRNGFASGAEGEGSGYGDGGCILMQTAHTEEKSAVSSQPTSRLDVFDSTLQTCHADDSGGALYASGSRTVVFFLRTNIISCTASRGGAVVVAQGAMLTFNLSTASNCVAVDPDSAQALASYAASLDIFGQKWTSFERNFHTGLIAYALEGSGGGFLICNQSTANLINVVGFGCRALDQGGFLHCDNGGQATLINCVSESLPHTPPITAHPPYSPTPRTQPHPNPPSPMAPCLSLSTVSPHTAILHPTLPNPALPEVTPPSPHPTPPALTPPSKPLQSPQYWRGAHRSPAGLIDSPPHGNHNELRGAPRCSDRRQSEGHFEDAVLQHYRLRFRVDPLSAASH